MRRILLFALTALFAASSSAQSPINTQVMNRKFHQEWNSNREGFVHRNRLVQKSATRHAPLDAIGDSITEQPEGTLFDNQTWSSDAFYVYWNYTLPASPAGKIATYVLAPDSTIYLKSPFSQIPTNTWLKLTKENDSTYAAGPQYIYTERYGNTVDSYVAERLVRTMTDEGINYFEPSDGRLTYRFTYKDGVLKSAEEPDYIIGLTDVYGGWTGFGDYNILVEPVTDKVVQLPEALKDKVEEYVLTSGMPDARLQLLANIATDGNTLYIKNPYNMADQWFSGKINGNTVTFPTRQYLAPDSSYGYHLYFMAAKRTKDEDEWGNKFDTYYFVDNFKMTLDADAKTLTTNPADSSAFIINAGSNSVFSAGIYADPVFKPFVKSNLRPAAPEVLSWDFRNTPQQGNFIRYRFLTEDIEGNFIKPEALTYRIFVQTGDGEPEWFSFTTDKYRMLKENMDEIPYDFVDGFDINGVTNVRYIYFYEDFSNSKVGAQLLYHYDDNTTLLSDTTWLDVPAVLSVNAVDADANAKVIAVSYYDMAGRQLSRPVANGLYIKRITLSDGRKKTIKTME